MNCMKVTRALVAAVSLAAIAFATGCNPAGVSDNTAQNKAAVAVTDRISITSTNVVLSTSLLATQDSASIATGIERVTYAPVVLSKLLQNGKTPYITFTFNQAPELVWGMAAAGDANNTATDRYIYNVAGTAASVKGINNYKIEGNTITFTLPECVNDQSTTASDDNNAFVIGNKYFVDFFVTMKSGDVGRVSVGFMPVLGRQDIGAFGDSNVSLYANTTEGQAYYSLFLLDEKRAFTLLKKGADSHTVQAPADESIVVDGNIVSTFTNFKNRVGNGTSYGGPTNPVYGSLNALANNGKTPSTINLRWTLAANATSYDVYTTDNTDLSKGWKYAGSSATIDPKTYPNTYLDFPFSLASYPITASRAVRIIPRLGNVTGNPAQIILKDTVCPVADDQDGQLSADIFKVTDTVTNYKDHIHGNAATEGEIVNVGTKNLRVITQADTVPEDYQVTGVSGTFEVSSTASDSKILTLSIDELKAFLTKTKVVLSQDQTLVALGPNAVGIFDKAFGTLSVYVHLKCCIPGGGTIAYTTMNTPITCSSLTATYADLAGNLMITRTSGGTSKSDGTLVIPEL